MSYPEDQSRGGMGKKLLIGAGLAAAAVATVAVVGGGAYLIYNKKKKSRKVVVVNGQHREIDCDVLIDDRGMELPGQQFDECGRCINEQEVVSRAVSAGIIPPQGGETPGYGNTPGYGQNPQMGGYGQPMGYDQMNNSGPYGQPGMGGPQMNYGGQMGGPMGGYGQPMGYDQMNNSGPYGQPGMGCPPMNYGAPPQDMGYTSFQGNNNNFYGSGYGQPGMGVPPAFDQFGSSQMGPPGYPPSGPGYY